MYVTECKRDFDRDFESAQGDQETRTNRMRGECECLCARHLAVVEELPAAGRFASGDGARLTTGHDGPESSSTRGHTHNNTGMHRSITATSRHVASVTAV